MNNLEVVNKGVWSEEHWRCDMAVSAGRLQEQRGDRSIRAQAEAAEVHVAAADRALAGVRLQKEARFHRLQLRL